MGEYSRKLRARFSNKNPNKNTITQMSSTQFYAQRRMFCVINNVPYVANPNNCNFHRTWMDTLIEGGISEDTYRYSPRGYYLSPDLVWYKGSFQPVSIGEIKEHIIQVSEMLDIPVDTKVYSGGTADSNDVIKGNHYLGTIDDLLS